jgi:Molybdopterin converting factor, small subunit
MKVEVIGFGQLADIFKTGSIKIEGIQSTDGLLSELKCRYPGLANARFTIAVDRQLVNGNTALKDGSVVALLPPFSGG